MMRTLAILIALTLVGCATTRQSVPNTGITKLQTVTKHTATILDEQEGTIVKVQVLTDKAVLENKDIKAIAKAIEEYYKTHK